MMDRIWAGLVLASFLFGMGNGRLEAVSAAALEGAGAAAELCLALCGGLCLWSGILKLLETGGAAGLLGRLLHLPGRAGRAVTIGGYQIARKIFGFN